MKKTKQIILLSMLLIFSTYLFTQSIIDSNNDTIAIIDNNLIFNVEGDTIGEFLINGEIKNKLTETIIGNIEGSQLKNAEGNSMAYLDESDNVYDMNGHQVGKIQSQTLFLDSNDMTIGTSTSVITPIKLAAYFLFFFGYYN
jgi:5-fold beta-flower domain-containing protein